MLPRLVRASFALCTLLAACNPGVFDDLTGPAESGDAGDASAVDAGTLDAARDAGVDARAQLDSWVPPREDAEVQPVDAGADAGVDAGADAGVDAGPACFDPSASLISYFKFEGNAGDAKGGASVIAQGATYDTGRVGKALHTGEVAINQSRLDAPAALTISAWLRLTSYPESLNAAWLWKGENSGEDLTTNYWLVIAGPSFRAENVKYLSGSTALGHLGFGLTSGSEEQVMLTDQPFPLERYAHVAASFDGTRARLYLDGALVRDEAQFVVPRLTTVPVQLASALGGTVAPLTGQLDEVAFFDRALGPGEVRTLYLQDGVVCAP
ncbi:MAG: LamG domain-containing protein [Polyangiales bacterium]